MELLNEKLTKILLLSPLTLLTWQDYEERY